MTELSTTWVDNTGMRVDASYLNALGTKVNRLVSAVFKVTDYGATGDGTTDDTAAIQSAINAAQTAGGGLVFFPAGTYMVAPTTSPALSVTSNNVSLVGANRHASVLKKSADGVLLSVHGTGTSSDGSTHVRFISLTDIGLHGNSHTGALLRLYYCGDIAIRDVWMGGGTDIGIDAVEWWDSRAVNLAMEAMGGAAGSNTPCVYLRNSVAASGFGYSADNINQIHFDHCRFEAFTSGAIWVEQGVSNTNNPNGIYLTDCKMESKAIRSGPFLKTTTSCLHVHVKDLYAAPIGFASGSSTAITVIQWQALRSTLESVFISNPTANATVAIGVDALSASTLTPLVMRDVFGSYTTAPTTAHVNFNASSTGDFVVDDCTVTNGTRFAGTMPRGGSSFGLMTGGANWTPPGYASGYYYLCNSFGNSGTSNVLVNGTLRLSPFVVTAPLSITKLWAEITSAGDAASVLRLGIYADDGTTAHKPNTLVLDGGTIAGNSATVQEVTVSQTLQPGLYWAAGAVQVVTTTQPTVRTVLASTIAYPLPLGTSLPGAGVALIGWAMTGVTGALPNNIAASVTVSNLGPPRIGFKVA